MIADFVEIAEFNDFEQGVFDDRVGKTGSHVADGRPFFLCLLDAGVHKDGAARSKVNRHVCLGCHLRKFSNVHLHGIRKRCNERATSRRAGFIQHNVLNDTVFYLQTLHVLAADVKNEVNVGHERFGTAQVGDCLNLTGIRAECFNQDAFTVSRRGHVADDAILGHGVVDGVHDLAGSAEDVAVVIVVPGIEQLALLAHNCSFHGG